MSRVTSFGAAAPRDQHGADQQVGATHQFLDRGAGGEHGGDGGAELGRQALQRIGGTVDHGDLGAHAHGDGGRMAAGHAATQNHHFSRRHARHATQQHAAATLGLLQRMRAHLRGEPAGDFGHRSQQRQRAVRGGDGFVGDADGAGVDQVLGLHGIGCQVQVGEQDLALAELLALGCQRLLHLHDHVGFGEHLVRALGDAGTRRHVVGVVDARTQAGTGFHQHLVAVMHQFLHRGGDEAHAVFVVLDFFGHTDAHGSKSLAGGWM
ncbi:hypothetical protein UU5_09749 [Rhodanobacter sp. 115]|nr:hypothetical protein UU5_09749 [Rhodanobacter sp. 115]